MIRVADYIMQRIVEAGVDHIFYVPGGQSVYLMDGLRREEKIKGVAVHHEQAAAMAALAYGQYTNRLGVGMVTTGCSGTNTITGLLHAWQDSIPCMIISGQQSTPFTSHLLDISIRQMGVQETDIVKLVKPITKYAVMLSDANDVGYELDKAIHEATTGRKGPVWIDVPLDIQNAMVDEMNLRRFTKEDLNPALSFEDVNLIRKRFESAERPVILAGRGIQSAGGEKKLKEFAEKNKLPILFTRFSLDMVEFENPYHMGAVCAVSANRYANFIIQNSDFVLSIGSRLWVDITGPDIDKFARAADIYVIDIDEEEHKKPGVSIDRLMVADANTALEQLYELDIDMDTSKWIDKCNHWKSIFGGCEIEQKNECPIDVKFFATKLSEHMQENSILLTDAGLTGTVFPSNCHLKKGGRLIHSYAQGEMGFVLPGAFGAACAAKDSVVVAVTGDGSVMMNLQEIQTLVRNQFNVKLIINNNNGYSGVRHGQKAHFRGKSIGTDSSNGVDFPDFSKIADAFGVRYVKIDKPDEIDEKLKSVFADEKPAICEVITDPDQFDLHNALVMYGKRKFGFRPIEDQSPFIDRNVFFEEMIVEPLEESSGKPM